MLSETNLRGTVQDRITWLKHTGEQCTNLVLGGADFRGFCWYPSIDCTDWCHACTKATGAVDPQGIWSLDEGRWGRHATELTYHYAALAQGRATWEDLPAYPFSGSLGRDLAGYVTLMNHWPEWQEREPLAA